MANGVYVQYDFPKELMFQLPFIQISDFAVLAARSEELT